MKKIMALILALGIMLCFAVTPAYADGAGTKEILVGDVSGDGSIEIDDATFLQRLLLNIGLPFAVNDGAADADEDGFVTVIDATNIQRWLLGLGRHLNIGNTVMEWFDKSKAYYEDYYFDGGFFTITRICQTHFYVYSSDYNMCYKLNGRLSDEWNVGDEVYCSFENIYTDDNNRAEADLASIEHAWAVPDPYVCYKPVIYLYPEQETEVSVKLELDGSFLYTRPAYEDGWQVTAAPDGTLTDQNGKTYPYLFWEAKLNTEYDFSSGFCVKGSDSEAFLRESLTKMGLNQQETEDFIGFWVPFMRRNPYNVISFQTDAYTDAAKLSISPQPDTALRVFMAWYAADEAVDIPAQELTAVARNGFTAVEWGGQFVGKE